MTESIDIFEAPAVPFLFVGNDRCLDFLNTMIADQGKLVDLLQNMGDLLRWFVEADVLTPEQAKDLAGRWSDTAEAEAALADVRNLRAQLITLVDGLIMGIPPAPATLATLNTVLLRQARYEQIIGDDTTGWALREQYELREPRDVLAPLARAAAVLLSERDLARIRKCENPVCVLHFYDTSKNGSRRWCDTRTCGNRVRVAHHYQRRHEHQAGLSHQH